MHTKHIQQDSHRQDPARKQGLRLPLRIRQKPAHLCRRPNSCRCTTAVTSEQCTAIIRQCNLNSYRQSYRQKNRLKGAATQPQPRQEKLDLCRRPNSCRCTTAVTSEQRTAIARQCTIKNSYRQGYRQKKSAGGATLPNKTPARKTRSDRYPIARK